MEQLNNLDVLFLIITGVSALVGIARGMAKELLSLLGWVLAAAALIYMIPVLNPIMEKYIASKILAGVVSGLVILIVFVIVWILTVDKISSVIRSSKLSALDRILGFIFGAARGMLIVILIAMLITSLIPEESKKGIFAESRFFAPAADCAEPLVNMIPDNWKEEFKEKSEDLGFGEKKEQVKEDKKVKADKKADKSKKESKDKKSADKKAAKADNKKESGSPLQLIDNNLEMLQKSGEELFNRMAQPKPEGAPEADGDTVEDMSSDLDKLLDALDDKVVTTDENTPALKSETQKINEKIKKKEK